MNVTILTLYVNDVAKEKSFYTEVVGLPVDADNSNHEFVMLHSPNGMLFALEDKNILPPGHAHPAGSFEIGFEVDDVDSTFAAWKSKGTEIVHEPSDKPFGREFLAKDPEGNYLSVYRLRQN